MPHRIIAHETLFVSIAASIASGVSWLGAIMFTDSTRWFFVTLAVSTMTATFLSLRFRKADESVATAVGRGGLAIMLSIFGSRGLIYYWKLEDFNNDLLLLGMMAMGVCIVAYFVGIAMLVALDKSSGRLGVISLDALLNRFGLERTKNKPDS